MSDVLSIALSGLMAQTVRLSVSANNIANANTTGAVPSENGPVSTVYKPLRVDYTPLYVGENEAAGVRADVAEINDGYTKVYDPSSVYANAEGLIAAPNVSLEAEAVNILESRTLFSANLAVIETYNEMLNAIMDSEK